VVGGRRPFPPKMGDGYTRLWKSLTSTVNNDFARWRHSAPFWRHHNYIGYLLWCWPLLSFRLGFSYIVRKICGGLCTLSKYRFWILIVSWLLPSIQNTCIWWPHWYQNRWPCTVYDRWPAIFSVGFFGLSPFYAWRILHSTSLLRLSVRPSVCPSVGLS